MSVSTKNLLLAAVIVFLGAITAILLTDYKPSRCYDHDFKKIDCDDPAVYYCYHSSFEQVKCLNGNYDEMTCYDVYNYWAPCPLSKTKCFKQNDREEWVRSPCNFDQNFYYNKNGVKTFW
jgi:hypothetical protein